MKLSFALSTVLGLAAALDQSAPRQAYRKRSTAVQAFDGDFTPRAAKKPADAPAGYETFLISAPSHKRSTDTLEAVPAGVERRQESVQALRRLRRQVQASDFYECQPSNPPPLSADCRVIVDSVSQSRDELIVAQNSCLVFSYQTCQGYFCSLCETLSTSTDFIGSQLDLVDALCVVDGEAGAIVGEEAPAYSVGFTRAGRAIPGYDVC